MQYTKSMSCTRYLEYLTVLCDTISNQWLLFYISSQIFKSIMWKCIKLDSIKIKFGVLICLSLSWKKKHQWFFLAIWKRIRTNVHRRHILILLRYHERFNTLELIIPHAKLLYIDLQLERFWILLGFFLI